MEATMAAETKPDKGTQYIETIRNEYRAAIKGSTDYVVHAVNCGEALNAAKKEVGNRGWQDYLDKNFSDIGDRTRRDWMRWAKPENKKKLEEEDWKRVSKIAGTEKGLTVREINHIVKKPPTPARKAALEKLKDQREADKLAKEAEQGKTLEEQIGDLGPEHLLDILEDQHGLEYLALLREGIAKRLADTSITPARPPPKQQEQFIRKV
jgi:hypothetical protein